MDYPTNQKYGLLLTPDIKLHRKYFDEMVKLIGIYVIYKPVKKSDEKYNMYAEQTSGCESSPMLVGCIFEEHPTQQTLRKMQWVAELTENASIIHVPYDLPNIQ